MAFTQGTVFSNALSPYPAYGTCASSSREAELARREAELAQRERMLAQREESFERQVALNCTLGCVPQLVNRMQEPLAEVPAQWKPLVRRLWQCWVASAAGLLWNWVCILALWASVLNSGKNLLFAGGLLLIGPPAAWWGWYLPLCHASHRDGGAAQQRSRWALISLAAHAMGCAFVALGPSGCGVSGLLTAMSLVRRQELTLGATLLLNAAYWLGLSAFTASLWQRVRHSGMLVPLSARPAGSHHASSATPAKQPVAYAPV